MSAIGSYDVLNRIRFERCIEAAQNVRTGTAGKWIFKSTRLSGTAQLLEAWRAAVLKSVEFDYSGYALGAYLDAQLEINKLKLVDEDSRLARALGKLFTAAFVFDAPRSLPGLPEDALHAFCRSEYGEDDPSTIEAIGAAHAFYQRGLMEISPDTLVAFLIR
jgi:hypothetical protein